jgi:hypothetical protein
MSITHPWHHYSAAPSFRVGVGTATSPVSAAAATTTDAESGKGTNALPDRRSGESGTATDPPIPPSLDPSSEVVTCTSQYGK